jgi:hypothetical protein
LEIQIQQFGNPKTTILRRFVMLCLPKKLLIKVKLSLNTLRINQVIEIHLFWTSQKDPWPIYLGPIQFKAQIPRLAKLLPTHPFHTRGVHRTKETGSNEPQHVFARSRNKLSSGYTCHDFVTARARCAITTAL